MPGALLQVILENPNEKRFIVPQDYLFVFGRHDGKYCTKLVKYVNITSKLVNIEVEKSLKEILYLLLSFKSND